LDAGLAHAERLGELSLREAGALAHLGQLMAARVPTMLGCVLQGLQVLVEPLVGRGIARRYQVSHWPELQVRNEERIGLHALYFTTAVPADFPPDGQSPGQLTIDDALTSNDDETAVGS
jgi:hypothetical protein